MTSGDYLITLGFALFSTLSVAVTTLQPVTDEAVLVVGNPMQAAIRTLSVVAQADGAIVDGTPYSFAVVARSSKPNFIPQLYKHGAWLVISPRILTGCFGLSNRR